jgi:basic membrane protein A
MRSRRRISVCLLVVVVVLMVVAGGSTQAKGKGTPRALLLINGTLGDKSYFDSAAEGMKRMEKELGMETRIVEMGVDQTVWEPTVWDMSEDNWDIILMGTWQMQAILEKVAPNYPDQKYILFDGEVPGLDNVLSILYRQNEGSFLAGALAALMTKAETPLTNPNDKLIGFLGGTDSPVINDFLVGYIQGAKYIDKDIKMLISYVGDFNDPAKGKEMALSQYMQGVDIGFNAAGQAGLGQIEAAKVANKYCIGVNSDQALIFEDTDPEKANKIITSMLKRVDNSIFYAVENHLKGELEFGKTISLGVEEECTNLAYNKYYEKLVPQDIQKQMADLTKKVINKEIVVDTYYGMPINEFNQKRRSVMP